MKPWHIANPVSQVAIRNAIGAAVLASGVGGDAVCRSQADPPDPKVG